MLLDSQVVLWSVSDDPRLGASARSLLVEAPRRFVSVITHVELTIKTLRGKLGVPADFPDRLADFGLLPLALENRHVAGLRTFEQLNRHDPFDRLLIAQAHVEGLRFLTADRALLDLDLPWVVDATL